MTTPYPVITAKIICDSIASLSPRLTTFELTYPRYIHAEVMTHRVFSRNAQSSRAIPVKRRLERVRNNPVKPIYWGANQGGMQAKREEVDNVSFCAMTWEKAAESAAMRAEQLMDMGLHKQWANRLLEPFDTITTIVTGTKWENFFGLRCHPDAQPEFQNLAWKMADLYYNFGPKHLEPYEWHLPYIGEDDFKTPDGKIIPPLEQELAHLAKYSVARCARVSYLNHDQSKPDPAKDIALHDRLLDDGHMSPFEHQARAIRSADNTSNFGWGWSQYRKRLDKPEVRSFDYAEACQHRPWSEPYGE